MADDVAGALTAGEALLALQAEDLLLDQLAYRREHLEPRVELDTIERRRATLETDRVAINADRRLLSDRQDALELEIDEAARRISSLEERSKSGLVPSFRDQEALSTELASIARRKGELEDEELEIMEALDPYDADLARLEAERVTLTERTRALEVELSEAERSIDLEIDAVRERRQSAVPAVPPGLLAEYEKLRGRLGGIGVAKIVHGTCSGCNLHLSATELDRMRHLEPDALEHCDQCGRLLVP
jgi:predicted  nucleic acid-binding Zn-ribbon protein